MNKACKVIWSHIHRHMVVVSELVCGRGKTQSTRSADGGTEAGHSTTAHTALGAIPILATCMALGFGLLVADQAAAQSLPTGAQVAAGQASVTTSGANMVVDQSTQRAVINWQSFNVGTGAHVHFNQPSSSASTLNRVLGPEASTILGRITAPGQVIISNGNGVFFGRGASVDVGSLVATTHSIGTERFMAGDLVFDRNGATGSVINEGELRAKLEGYIALIAPEVRNAGLIVAHKGTVALAAGEQVELQLDAANKLANIRVQASQWQALVENRHVIEAEGGLVILSAQAVHELQGGVVRHSGTISAKSMTEVGGRVILSGDQVHLERGSTIDASGATGGGRIETSGRVVHTEGANIQASASQGQNGLWLIKQGLTVITQGVADTLARTLNTGTNVSAVASGDVVVQAGVSLVTNAEQDTQLSVETLDGGDIELQSDARVESQSGKLDMSMKADGRFDMAMGASITTRGGSARFLANGQMPALLTRKPDEEPEAESAALEPVSPPTPDPQARIAGTVDVSSAQAQGGTITVEAEHILLTDSSTLLATGGTGGGAVLVGGDWQGGANAERRVFDDANALRQATTVTMESGALIDASATHMGDGGTVVLWSNIHQFNSITSAQGVIFAKGGAQGGDGGQIETSGRILNVDGVSGSAAATQGRAGEWLFDPTNISIVGSGGTASTANNGTNINASSINNLLNGGTSVTVTTFSGGGDLGDLTVHESITKSSGSSDVTLTLRAANSIVISQAIQHTGGSGRLNLVIDADNDTAASTAGTAPSRNGGGITILGANLSTGGGFVTFGGTSSGSFTGGDLYVNGSSAVTITTSGGAVDVKGNLIIGNSSSEGFSINTAGGSIDLRRSIDSGNQYTLVTGNRTWQQAFDHAKSQGGWLATIGSSLENSIAIQSAGYASSWLGGQRIVGTNEWRWTADPAYNASTNPMVFFYQGVAC